MYCPQCGRPIVSDARYCVHCGAPIPAELSAGRASPPGSAPIEEAAPSSGAASITPPAYEPARSPYAPPGPERAADPPPPSTPAWALGMPDIPPGPTAHTVYGQTPVATVAPAVVPGVIYAGFWRRFWGLCVDRFLVGIVMMPVGIAFGIRWFAGFDPADMTPERLMRILFGSVIVFWIRTTVEWLYASLMMSSSRHATLGQMILGLKTTDLEGRGIGFGRATVRYLASWLSAITLLVGFIMAAFTQRKQALHDMIAGTLVVRA